MSFGKNRVQYDKERFWSHYRFNRFDTYFYKGGKGLSIYTAQVAEKEIAAMEKKLDYYMSGKIQFIIFNTLGDLKGSNIGLVTNENFNVGGITHLSGTKIILYFNGSHKNLELQIRNGIAQILINQMLYGEQITANIKNAALINLPEWYVPGLVSYLSNEWDTEIDNKVRDGVLSGKYEKINLLDNNDAVIVGHSIWKFIEDRFGKTSIPNIIYMTKVSRGYSSGFLYVLGMSYENLIQLWFSHYKTLYLSETESFDDYPISKDIPGKNRIKKNRVCSQVKLSPNGDYITYVTNEYNKKKVWLYDVKKQKAKKIYRKGHKLDEKQDFSYPLLAWHPRGNILTIITEHKGGLWFFHYDVRTRKTKKKQLFNFDKILDFSYSHDGTKLLFSAVQNGQSDIFVYFNNSKTFDQITNDIYDDRYPCFIDHSQKIVFSSNRLNDTLVHDIRTYKKDYSNIAVKNEYYDLFLFNYQTKGFLLRRVTNTPKTDEIKTEEYDDENICYLSDENGIFNMNIAYFDSAISYVDTATHYRYFTVSKAVTNYSRNIEEVDVENKSNKIASLSYFEGMYHILYEDLLPVDEMSNIDLTKTSYSVDLNKKEEKILNIKPPKNTEKNNQNFLKQKSIIIGGTKQDSTEFIDINNYAFTDEKPKHTDKNTENIEEDSLGFLLPKQRNYDVQYFISELVNQVDFSFLNYSYQPFTGGISPIYQTSGFNVMFKIGLTDLLEDYRIVGGANLSVNLSNNEYFLSYSMLKGKVDKEILFHRNSLENIQDNAISEHKVHQIFYRLSFPFNSVFSIRGTGILRSDLSHFLSINTEQLQMPNKHVVWGGLKAEVIFDNTRERGLNIFYGTRYKIFAEHYQMIDKENENIFVTGFDFRHYQKIHKSFIWANRIAGSTTFGNNQMIYYLGGVDNWLFPKFNAKNQVDYTKDYVYQSLITNMRGFEQNVRHGNSFLLFNSELRMPVFRFFSQTPIKSAFLYNFQVVAFGDIGSAFEGLNPFSEENSTFEEYIYQYPITVKVIKQKSAFVGGYGFGVRTKILGYFLRADWAWGYEDNEILPAMFYLSLNMDF
jgi:WD40-like Beta Propeller Repeat